MENMVCGSLLFPAVVLTALAVQEVRTWFPWMLAGLAIPSLIYGQLYFGVPMISPTARAMGHFVADRSRKTDLVLTNLRPMSPRYKASDIFSGKATRVIADRLLFFEFDQLDHLDRIPQIMKSNTLPTLFMVSKSRPLDPALRDKLQQEARLEATASISIPPQRLNLAEKLRAFVWYKVMRKGVPPADAEAEPTQDYSFEIYRLR